MLRRYRQNVAKATVTRRSGGDVATEVFVPTSISNCSLWLDGTSVFNGTKWIDKSSSLNFATKDAGNITTTTVNGIQALEFSNGRMNFQTPALFSGSTGSSVFIVVKTTGGISNGHPIGTILPYDSHFNYSEQLYENIGFSFRESMGGIYPSNILQIYENIANDGGQTYFYKNGTVLTNRPYGSDYTVNPFYVGSPGYYFYGTICEIIIFKKVVSSTERGKVEGYLAHKWGLQANLPTGHPYKSGAP